MACRLRALLSRYVPNRGVQIGLIGKFRLVKTKCFTVVSFSKYIRVSDFIISIQFITLCNSF